MKAAAEKNGFSTNGGEAAKDLAERFEEERRRVMRDPVPMLVRDFAGEDFLDRADPTALAEAADSILLAQAARAAIRAAARLERVWRSSPDGRDEFNPRPADGLTECFICDCDLAACFFCELRQRQAKLEHMGLANQRARAALSLAAEKAVLADIWSATIKAEVFQEKRV